jgi:hypothetical protein
MVLKRHLSATIAVTAALAVPTALAGAATIPASASAATTPVVRGYPMCSAMSPGASCYPWLMTNPTPTTSVNDTYPRCPANYTGPINPATGCPPWMMIYGPPPTYGLLPPAYGLLPTYGLPPA